MVKVINLSKSLEEIEAELQTIVEENKAAIKEFKKEIETAEENAEEAKRTMIDAKKGDDPQAYAQAVAEQRTASDIVGFYEGKLEKLKSEPLVTEEQYKDYTKRIKSEMDRINQQARKRISKLLDELEAIQSELSPAYAKTNELLSNLQNNIYKHSADKQMELARKTGKPIVGSELNNEYKDGSVISGIEHILNSHVAKNIKWKVNR